VRLDAAYSTKQPVPGHADESRRETSRLATWSTANEQRVRWTGKEQGPAYAGPGSAFVHHAACGGKIGDGLRDALDVRGTSDV
jgi:hypothetical protein